MHKKFDSYSSDRNNFLWYERTEIFIKIIFHKHRKINLIKLMWLEWNVNFLQKVMKISNSNDSKDCFCISIHIWTNVKSLRCYLIYLMKLCVKPQLLCIISHFFERFCYKELKLEFFLKIWCSWGFKDSSVCITNNIYLKHHCILL